MVAQEAAGVRRAKDAAETAGVADRALHDVADRVLDDLPLLVELERARLRRRAEALAGGLVAQEAAALVGAARLAREPHAPRVERVETEVVEARVEVRKGLLQVEATHLRRAPERLAGLAVA